MKITLNTHPGLIIENFTYDIISIYHEIGSKKILVTILIKSKNIDIKHISKELELINGIPTDQELVLMVQNYINSLRV